MYQLRCLRTSLAILGLAAFVGPAQALADAKPGTWADVAEFSFVATGGNAETSTLGFKNALSRAWERSSFELKAGGVRAEATTTTRVAVGPTPMSFVLVESSSTESTAENYFLNGRYNHKISERFFWFTGAGWDRNRFAGIDNRYAGVAGFGNVWVDKDNLKFRTDYAATFTKQEDVVTAANADDTFAGFRFSWKLVRTFGAGATFGNDLVVDDNLEETSDLRADMTNWIAVTMSARLALKVSIQWLYDNEPSLRSVALENPLGTPTGQSVLVELEDLDTVFTTSLVVNF